LRVFKPLAGFTRRILRILLLAVFVAAGTTYSPFRLLAQQPAPAGNTAAPPAVSSSNEAAKPEAADSAEAQNNLFRLEGPLVKATAKALNLSLETTARAFEIINFLIIVLGLGVPLSRWLPKFLRNRREKLSADLESARKVTEDANTRLSAIEAKLSGLDTEIAQIRSQVELESKQDEARIKAAIAEESARIVESVEQEIGASAAQARRSLRDFAADLAIEQAAKQLVLTPENDQTLIKEFLRDVALTGATGDGAHKGEQN
jgi:F-type H+-transporting ATPase subunit b